MAQALPATIVDKSPNHKFPGQLPNVSQERAVLLEVLGIPAESCA
jgi:hypothetical protein